MFGKYNGFVSKARVSACMYFLVIHDNSIVLVVIVVMGIDVVMGMIVT
jgi:hypothetical protein